MKLDNLFFWIGKKIARHPETVIVLSLLIISLILSGLIFLEFEVINSLIFLKLKIKDDPQNLWVAKDSKTNYEQSFISQKFGSFFRINQFIMRVDDDNDERDIFQKEYLALIYELQVIR